MSDSSEPINKHSDEQWDVVTADWWKTVFNTVSWSYPALQGSPSRQPSKRTALLRISRANQALKHRISRYFKIDHAPMTASEELSVDLVGVRVVEEILEPYEEDAGFSMLDDLFKAMKIGCISDDALLSHTDLTFGEYTKQQWDRGVQILVGDILERVYDDEMVSFTQEEGEEKLKSLSPLWSSCLEDTWITDLARSTDLMDLTDSELSADSDLPPMTPKAGKFTLSALSPSPMKTLSATASSFIPSPARLGSLGSPSSSSASPSPSPPALDIINFPTLKQTILLPTRRIDHESKSKSASKRQGSIMPSFLVEKAELSVRKSRTRQMVDKMRSANDARRPDPDFILMVDERPTTKMALKSSTGDNQVNSKTNKKRARRGREPISTVSTDDASVRSSSVERSGNKQRSLGPPIPSRSQGTRLSSKLSKRAPSVSVKSSIAVPTPSPPAFLSSAPSVSSFGGSVTSNSFSMTFPPPPPPHPAFLHMNGRTAYPPQFPYSYYSGMPGGGVMPLPNTFSNSYQTPYPPYNPYGKGVITGTGGIRHVSW